MSMNKVKTRYQIKNGYLLSEGKVTEIRIVEDYFYLGDQPLNIYQEDNVLFVLKPMIPFLKWPMISTPLDLFIDPEGCFWGPSKSCIFDQYVKTSAS